MRRLVDNYLHTWNGDVDNKVLFTVYEYNKPTVYGIEYYLENIARRKLRSKIAMLRMSTRSRRRIWSQQL